MKRAIGDSFLKLHPRPMMKNPVMFVVEVGAAMTTLLTVRDFAIGAHDVGFTFQITLWLWFTVLFANFAEAMAEGRGKAQADTLAQDQDRDHRAPPRERQHRRLWPPRSFAAATSCWWSSARPSPAMAT